MDKKKKEINVTTFDASKSVYYVETEQAFYQANDIDAAIHLWASHYQAEKDISVVVTVGRLG